MARIYMKVRAIEPLVNLPGFIVDLELHEFDLRERGVLIYKLPPTGHDIRVLGSILAFV